MSKRTKWSIGGGLVLVVAAVLVVVQLAVPSDRNRNPKVISARFGVASAQAVEPIGHIGTGKSAEAIERAGKADRYVYALFLREENDAVLKARSLIASARKKISRKSELVEINVSDPSDQDVVKRFGTGRASMPLVLVLAPNGAIMGGFAMNQLSDDTRLVDAVGCKASEQTMKALQQRNMVALCVQSRKTSDNEGAMQGVEEFLKDPKYGATTAVVTADPSNTEDVKFLSKLGVAPNPSVASTVLLAPPGSVVATFQGATQKDKIEAAVLAAAAPRSGGCCGPGQTCGPTGGAAVPQKAPMTSQPMPAQPQVQVKQIPAPAAPTTSATAPTTKAVSSNTGQGK